MAQESMLLFRLKFSELLNLSVNVDDIDLFVTFAGGTQKLGCRYFLRCYIRCNKLP